MKTLLKLFSFIWLIFCTLFGISFFLETPEQVQRDEEFIEKEIKPSVDFVKHFRRINGRLPTNREFYTWVRDFHKDYSSDLSPTVDSLIGSFGKYQYIRDTSHVINDDISKFSKADWNKDFAIGVWRGEWWEYYFSWSDTYDSNDYSWIHGFIGLVEMILIGLLPFVYWFWRNRKSQRHKI